MYELYSAWAAADSGKCPEQFQAAQTVRYQLFIFRTGYQHYFVVSDPGGVHRDAGAGQDPAASGDRGHFL